MRAVCERAFREYGLPRVMRSDNGVPFAMAVGGLSSLSVWWIKLGILPERIEPAHPEQNGGWRVYRHLRDNRRAERVPADTATRRSPPSAATVTCVANLSRMAQLWGEG